MIKDSTNYTLLAVAGILAILTLAVVMVLAAVRVTADDRHSRSERAHACANIENEQTRALCLFSIPGR